MRDKGAPPTALDELGLDTPLLRQLVNPSPDEWAVRRMWQGIQRRRATPAASARRARWRVVSLSALATLILLAVLTAATYGAASRLLPALTAGIGRSAAQPLLTREAQRFESLEAPPATATAGVATPARVEFADGSSIEAAPGARVDALASAADEFVVLVRRGRAAFRVTPGGPRLWRIEAHDVRVDVVGTELSVASDETGTSIQVDVGRVLVRSPELPGGVQSVNAGQALRLNVQPPPALHSPSAAPTERPGEASTEASTEASSDPPAVPSPTSPSRPMARITPPRAPPRASELWQGVDDARRDGRPARAAALLARLLRDYPSDSQVALAAFTLGVLQLDRLGQPAEAATSFQHALELGIGTALREDVYLRWAQALDGARALDTAEIEPVRIDTVLAEYVRLYPRGRHRAAIQSLVAHRTAPAPTSPRSEPTPSGLP